VAQVHTINDKAIKAIKQAIACHGFCGSEVLWKITLTGWPTCRGQGLLLKAKDLTLKAKDFTFKAKTKAKDSKFVLEDTSRPRTKAEDNNTGIGHTSEPLPKLSNQSRCRFGQTPTQQYGPMGWGLDPQTGKDTLGGHVPVRAIDVSSDWDRRTQPTARSSDVTRRQRSRKRVQQLRKT